MVQLQRVMMMRMKMMILELVVSKIIIFILLIITLCSCTMNTIRLNELDQTIQSSLSIIVNNLVVSLLKQFDGWKSLNLNILQFVSSGVHLGNDKFLSLCTSPPVCPKWGPAACNVHTTERRTRSGHLSLHPWQQRQSSCQPRPSHPLCPNLQEYPRSSDEVSDPHPDTA